MVRIGQAAGSNVIVNIDKLLPQGDAVAAALSRVAAAERRHDDATVILRALRIVGGVSSDGVKTKSKQKLCDISLHFFTFHPPPVNELGITLPPPPVLSNRLIALFNEGTDAAVSGKPADVIRALADVALRKNFPASPGKLPLTLAVLQERFTFLTDHASVEAAILGASVSIDWRLDKKWICCLVHQCSMIGKDGVSPDKLFKSDDPDLKRIGLDIISMFSAQTAIAQVDLEYALELRPVEKAKTRFLFACDTTVRCLGISKDLFRVADSKKCTGALNAFRKIRIYPDEHRGDAALADGLADKSPSLRATVAVLKPVRELCDFAQSSRRCTMHICSFEINRALRKQSALQDNFGAAPSNSDPEKLIKVETSRLSSKLVGGVIPSAQHKLRLHHLIAAGALLVPMWVKSDWTTCFACLDRFFPGNGGPRLLTRLKAAGRELIIYMMIETAYHSDAAIEGNDLPAVVAEGTIAQNEDEDEDDAMLLGPVPMSSEYPPGPYATAEEEFAAYELYCHTSEVAIDSTSSGYSSNLLDLSGGGSYDGVGVSMFWIHIESKFPRISEASIRILAIPVSQALSERFFSELLNAQTPQQSNQSLAHLEERLSVKAKDGEGELTSFGDVSGLLGLNL